MAQIIEGVSHVDATELEQLLQSSKSTERSHPLYIIDVREPEEYATAHIPGVPLLPMGSIPDVIQSFDRQAEYVFVCRSGRRSFDVCRYFQMNGITNVHNYEGGMLQWISKIQTGLEHVVTDFSMKALELRDEHKL